MKRRVHIQSRLIEKGANGTKEPNDLQPANLTEERTRNLSDFVFFPPGTPSSADHGYTGPIPGVLSLFLCSINLLYHPSLTSMREQEVV
jgi:hypothetical protein